MIETSSWSYFEAIEKTILCPFIILSLNSLVFVLTKQKGEKMKKGKKTKMNTDRFFCSKGKN